jgi:hypothetical protein
LSSPGNHEVAERAVEDSHRGEQDSKGDVDEFRTPIESLMIIDRVRVIGRVGSASAQVQPEEEAGKSGHGDDEQRSRVCDLPLDRFYQQADERQRYREAVESKAGST